jgi:hypothetical protein
MTVLVVGEEVVRSEDKVRPPCKEVLYQIAGHQTPGPVAQGPLCAAAPELLGKKIK